MNLRLRTGLFSLSCLGVALANASALRALYELGRQDSTASHLIVIPFVTMGLLFQDRAKIFSVVRWDVVSGLAGIAVGLAIGLAAAVGPASNQGISLTLVMTAQVVTWAGLFLLFYGRHALRSAAFPMLFLVFTIPIPKPVLDIAVAVLKKGSTEAVAGLFTVTGTPYHRQGFVFSLPTFVIEVADECSGIRSSIALLLTSLLAGYMMLTSPWKKALLVLVIIPLTMFKNGIRIVTLSLLAMHVDPSFLTGQLHHEGGVVFFLLALALLFPLFAVLRKSETKRNPRVTPDFS